MQLSLVFLFYYISSTTALTTPKLATISSGNNLGPPRPVAGESVDQWVSQLFGSLDDASNSTNTSFSARSSAHARRGVRYLGDYREYNGIHELTWDDVSAKTSYNLSIDLSDSCVGLNLTSEIGVYTFANGTTTTATQLQDIISDIWNLAPTPSDRRLRWANHTASVARMALVEANEVLNSGLICQNFTPTQVLMNAASGKSDLNPVHDELRRLLSSAWSYWTATIVSTLFGAALGATLAAGVQQHFSGNITSQNVVQTAVVVGATVLIGGILMRLHENGRIDRVAEVANNRAYLGRQALVQNAHIARWREAFAEARRRSTDRNWDAEASLDMGGFSVDGQTSPGSLASKFSMPQTPEGASGQYLCLSDREAVDAMRALGEMSSDEMRLKMMETINEVERERMERGQITPRGTSEWQEACTPLKSTEPSFKTTKWAGEASAADLVELENIASGSGGGEGNRRDGGDGGGAGGGGGTEVAGGGGAGGGGGTEVAGGGGGGQEDANGGKTDVKGKGKANLAGGGR